MHIYKQCQGKLLGLSGGKTAAFFRIEHGAALSFADGVGVSFTILAPSDLVFYAQSTVMFILSIRTSRKSIDLSLSIYIYVHGKICVNSHPLRLCQTVYAVFFFFLLFIYPLGCSQIQKLHIVWLLYQ